MELAGLRTRRRRLLGRARGRVLEAGIGTGRNLEHYPPGVELSGVDVAGRMLERARRRAQELGREVELRRADVQELPYDDGTFDTVAAACLFCSVADPVRGLVELRRVVTSEGQILLLEHVRPRNPVLGLLADLVSPLTRRLFGPSLNRRTEENARAAGLELVEVRRDGIWREIVARPGVDGPPGAGGGREHGGQERTVPDEGGGGRGQGRSKALRAEGKRSCCGGRGHGRR